MMVVRSALLISIIRIAVSFPGEVEIFREQISTQVIETLVFDFNKDNSNERTADNTNDDNGDGDESNQNTNSKFYRKFKYYYGENFNRSEEVDQEVQVKNDSDVENGVKEYYRVLFNALREINRAQNNQSEQLKLPNNTTSNSEGPVDFDEDEITWRVITREEPIIDYDYDKFKSEYERYLEELKKVQGEFNKTEFQPAPKSECNADKWYNIGPFTATCLLREKSNGPNQEIREEAKKSLNFIVKFWGWLLIIFILIFWCHFGVCNICCEVICPCSFCRIEDEYERLKQDLALNPPGRLTIRVKKKDKANTKSILEQKTYSPSETEIYMYKRLWRQIYHV